MNDIYLNSFLQILKEDTALYLEDHDSLNNSIGSFLEQTFNSILKTNDANEAMKLFVKNKVDILIVDIYEKDAMDRIMMLNKIKCFTPYLPMMAVVDDTIVGHTLENLDFGMNHVILKPREHKVFLKELNRVYHNIHLR